MLEGALGELDAYAGIIATQDEDELHLFEDDCLHLDLPV